MTDQDAMQSGEPLIKPRIDEDGVPWCDMGCPLNVPSIDVVIDALGDNKVAEDCWMSFPGDVCPVHTRRVARLAGEAREKQRLDQMQCDEMTSEAGKMAVEIRKLEAELAEANERREFWKRFSGTTQGQKEKLEAELAEAKKDTARLDWLESLPWQHLTLENGANILFEYTDIPGKSTLRAAIDDAREE